MANFIIRVREEPQLVTTTRESKTVWVAAGEYKGQLVRRNSETERGAVTLWLESAQTARNT
jgi:hypothetical protein